MKGSFYLFFALFLFPALGFSATRLPVPELETLPNGLQVAWFVNDNLPILDLALMVKSGYRDDPSGKAGTSQLVSSSLDRGAGGMSARQIAKAVEMLGASRYASADEDTFTVGMHGLAPDGQVLLELLGKLVTQPDFPEVEVKREHARLLDRWNHIGDYSEALAGLAFQRVIAGGTSYGRGSFLSVDEFKKVTRDDVIGFHKKHFTPKNSILMVVGRVKKAEFKEKVMAVFGGWTGEAPARSYKKHIDSRIKSSPGQIIIVDRPGLTQAQVKIGFRAPLVNAPEHYALVVANALLGEYFNSRLNALIRDKLGLTYGIGSSFNYSKDFASFVISSATRNESVGQLIRKSTDVLKDLKKGPIPADEVKMAKEYLVGGFPLATATLGAVATRWISGYVFDLGPDYLNEFVPKVQSVATQEVLAAVNKDFKLDQMFIVVAGDGKEIEKSLRGSKYNSIKRVSVRDLM